MTPAALSLLTTTFSHGTDRVKALGAWGAMAGISSAAGVFLGGVLAAGPGWRWVLFVNLPVIGVVLAATFRLFDRDTTGTFRITEFDFSGAVLGTGGMLLLIFALVRAPGNGWGAGQTVAELAGAATLLALFAVNETRVARPLVPLSIFRVPGLAAADATQVIALAGFYSAFFFVTLYMQDVLGFSAFRAGSAYVPVTVMVAVAAGAGSALITRIGTRPLIVSGALIASGGVFWLSQIPAHGSYLADLFPGLMIMGFGLGAVFVGVQTAANAGVPPSLAGLAGALVTASTQVGAALGLAIFSAVATARTTALLAAGASTPVALTGGVPPGAAAGGHLRAVRGGDRAARGEHTRRAVVHRDHRRRRRRRRSRGCAGHGPGAAPLPGAGVTEPVAHSPWSRQSLAGKCALVTYPRAFSRSAAVRRSPSGS
ncbi:MAG: MFS transporter [Trebonia sp.]